VVLFDDAWSDYEKPYSRRGFSNMKNPWIDFFNKSSASDVKTRQLKVKGGITPYEYKLVAKLK